MEAEANKGRNGAVDIEGKFEGQQQPGHCELSGT